MLLNQEGLSTADYAVAVAAKTTEEETGEPAAAIELPDGRIVTGKNKALLGAASAMLLNALKALADISDDEHLLASEVIRPVQELKVNYLGNHNPRLHTDEVLVALSVSAASNENAKKSTGLSADVKELQCTLFSYFIICRYRYFQKTSY